MIEETPLDLYFDLALEQSRGPQRNNQWSHYPPQKQSI